MAQAVTFTEPAYFCRTFLQREKLPAPSRTRTKMRGPAFRYVMRRRNLRSRPGFRLGFVICIRLMPEALSRALIRK